MPCYQPNTLPQGVTTAGRTGYATEAECLQACKEGACCEVGTAGFPPTCTVKPQCQCQGTGKTFKGIGTACTGSCSECLGTRSACYCYCTAQGGKLPRFINVRVQFRAAGGPTGCDKEIDQNLTLSFYTDYRDLSGGGGVVLCYVWAFFSDDFEVTATTSLNSSGNETMAVFAEYKKWCPQIGRWGISFQSGFPRTADSSGVCYSRHIGATGSGTNPVYNWASATATVLGIQA
jgi:hypothetical protein